MIAAASAMPATVPILPTGNPPAPAQTGPGQSLSQNDFLQLMTAQLENQDPLNPMTGAEFAAELAEFSTATGVQSLQTGLSGLSGTLNGMQATGLVGHSVAVTGNTLVLGANGATGALNLTSAAKDVTVTVADPGGNAVAKLDLGAMNAGIQTFAWNGSGTNGTPLPPGAYTFTVSATGANGTSVAAAPYAVVPVTAVALGGQNGPMLDLGGGLAPVALSAVQQVF